MASTVTPGSYTPTRLEPWPGRRRRSKRLCKGHKVLQYLSAEQRCVILGPSPITKSVECRLYGLHGCLRRTGCSRKEMLQVGQPELYSLHVLALVRAVGI